MEPLQKLYDFRELSLPEALFQLCWDPAEVEAALKAVPERSLTIQEGEGPIQAGDIVAMDLPPAGDLEAKRVQINVGKHFYAPAFEDALVGLTLGSEVTMPPRDGGRTGIPVQIKRRVYPPLEDQLIARMGIEGVETVDAYQAFWKQKLVDRDKRKKADAIYTMTMNQVVERSQFGDLEAEINWHLADQEAQSRKMAEAYGMDYEELLAQSIPPQYDTPEKKSGYLWAQAEKTAKQSLVVRRFTEQEGKAFTQEDFEAERQRYLNMGMTQEQVEQRLTYETYQKRAPFEYFKEAVLTHFEKNFKVVEK